jgi:hypothetical protein
MTEHAMDADARRKVFWLLKRLTSYTLWEKKRNAWEVFARAFEEAVKTWPADQPEQMLADDLPRIYDVLSCYNKGLAELRKGYRSIWRDGAPLERAVHGSDVVFAFLYTHPDYWERGNQQAPYPPKVEVLNKLMRASEFHCDYAPLESFGVDNTATLVDHSWLLDPKNYRYRFYELPYPTFPASLPEVPEPRKAIICSGQRVPVDGIWEPVIVHKDRLLGLISTGEIESNGCFNYFVQGIRAPKVIGDYVEALDRFPIVGTHWRLIWEDTRYKDGVIPDESEYFIEPKPAVAPNDDRPCPDVKTNEICPVSGLWQAIGYKNPPIHIAAETVMPDLSVRDAKGEMIIHYVTWRLIERD